MSNKKIFSICQFLPPNIIENMKKETRKSSIDQLEHGFEICSTEKSLEKINLHNTKISDTCTGTECRIVLKGCPENTKRIGAFHTHPKGTTFPSFGDIVSLEVSERKFICIGSDNEIRCIHRNIPVPIPFDIRSKEFEKFQESFKSRKDDCIIGISRENNER